MAPYLYADIKTFVCKRQQNAHQLPSSAKNTASSDATAAPGKTTVDENEQKEAWTFQAWGTVLVIILSILALNSPFIDCFVILEMDCKYFSSAS